MFPAAHPTGGALVTPRGPLFGAELGRGIALLLTCAGLAKAAVVCPAAADLGPKRPDASR